MGVCLRPQKNSKGVRWTKGSTKKPPLGRFLISPNPNGKGLMSVWSSPAFPSRKRVSKGYLGVILANPDNGGAVLQEVDEGAAQRAGHLLARARAPVSQSSPKRTSAASRTPKRGPKGPAPEAPSSGPDSMHKISLYECQICLFLCKYKYVNHKLSNSF